MTDPQGAEALIRRLRAYVSDIDEMGVCLQMENLRRDLVEAAGALSGGARPQMSEDDWQQLSDDTGFPIRRLDGRTMIPKIRWALPAEAAGARPPEPAGWQPIATAPTDGTSVLLWWPFWCPKRPTIGFFGLSGIQQWFAPECLEGDGDGPTYWMPLPTAPTGESR
jgi:hypothetical protein